MSVAEIYGIAFYLLGLITAGLVVETVRALIWATIFYLFVKRLTK